MKCIRKKLQLKFVVGFSQVSALKLVLSWVSAGQETRKVSTQRFIFLLPNSSASTEFPAKLENKWETESLTSNQTLNVSTGELNNKWCLQTWQTEKSTLLF